MDKMKVVYSPNTVFSQQKSLSPYGKLIRKLRIDRNINQKEHAYLLGVSPTFLSGIEKGKKAISMDIINKTIAVLNLTSNEEKQLIEAISKQAPFSIKITPKNEDEALVALLFAQAIQKNTLDRDKLKDFLREN